jgi:membrane associated rhomboid family serine protease
MFPIHDDAGRTQGRPYVNYSLIVLNAVVFTWEVLTTNNFTAGRATAQLYFEYGAIPRLVLAGDIPRVVTSMFIHGGILHIAGNMIFLYVFGDNVEDRFGHLKYLALYIIWGIFAALIHSIYALSTGMADVPAIGASGAISGVLGTYLILFPRARIYTIIVVFFITTVRIPALAFLPFWFILQIIFSLIGQSGGVAYLAHIGGFIAGVGTGFAWKYLVSRRQPSLVRPVRQIQKLRPKIEDVDPSLEPEVIEGDDFFEIIAHIHGISAPSDIHATYEPELKRVRISTIGQRRYELFAKLPESAANPIVEHIDYLNGIAKIHLRK